ncbi:Ubiquitin carboxyl-terminal hydrolase mindy-1 [Thalictrum thalictroides]|uniref:Ubiquitin carboxyl-terminal hydrolase mindy-1 n=1 Tax=Thalictrum thalictroides TaxID=46969 RepID=A0A7J6VRP9_THATH|nr:Ubiquitin carboxyl-terminal hydrolase mindy-1 [Thalictrum thalictroides]
MANEERRNDEELDKEHLYKTKIIEFRNRKTPIILQNDNGPCPLIAICNVLLLKNSLNLNLDASEVSLQRLLSLVAEKLIDSNNNTENKDAGYVENQQQNIGDAIDLLPRLATGLDVNVQFRKIDDFEFTRECAIFDLLNIPLCHGWIVDPQDADTASAIGSKSYNTLMGELVALETRNTEEMHKSNLEEDCIDFAAATTATLGVPSPCLSRGRSFDDPPRSESGHQRARKGDIEEEAELLRALQLSNSELPVCSDEGTHLKSCETVVVQDSMEVHTEGHHQIYQPEQSIILNTNATSSCNSETQSLGNSSLENGDSYSKVTPGSYLDRSSSSEPMEHFISGDLKEHLSSPTVVQNETDGSLNPAEDLLTTYKGEEDEPRGDQHIEQTCPQASTSLADDEQQDNQSGSDKTPCADFSATNTDPELSDSMREDKDISKSDTISLDGSEPIYEGEDCILDSGVASYENREPMYEGEVVLAELAERGTSEVHPQCDITQCNGELIRNFLRNNASQLTVYGLFCLMEKINEKDLCVFFRNNHFSTMYKFDGQLYLLATDQGYINQPDLVWEKLNEVNGDTVFMKGNFTEFKVDDHNSSTWDPQNAMATTVDYLSSIDNSTPTSSTFDSDLQLAIELQEQEFNSQPQRSHNSQQPSSGGNSRLITGPHVQRSNPSRSSSKQDTKSKDKCSLM